MVVVVVIICKAYYLRILFCDNSSVSGLTVTMEYLKNNIPCWGNVS